MSLYGVRVGEWRSASRIEPRKTFVDIYIIFQYTNPENNYSALDGERRKKGVRAGVRPHAHPFSGYFYC
jgi:hypothetical protein